MQLSAERQCGSEATARVPPLYRGSGPRRNRPNLPTRGWLEEEGNKPKWIIEETTTALLGRNQERGGAALVTRV
jgi:hypothetical protein